MRRKIDQLTNLAVRLVGLPQLVALLERLIQRNIELVRHHRHDLIHSENREAQCAADVANRGPRGQRAERANLRDVGLAVFLFDVLNHFAAAIFAEVDVDIRRFAAALVQKALEEQVVLQRADVADSQRIANQGSDARTAGRARDAAARVAWRTKSHTIKK